MPPSIDAEARDGVSGRGSTGSGGTGWPSQAGASLAAPAAAVLLSERSGRGGCWTMR